MGDKGKGCDEECFVSGSLVVLVRLGILDHHAISSLHPFVSIAFASIYLPAFPCLIQIIRCAIRTS